MSSRWLTDRPLRIDQKHVECFRRCLVRIQEGIARIISASAGDHPPTWFLLADHLPEKDGHALAEAGLALLGIAAALHIYRLAAHGFQPNSPMRQISPSLYLSIQKRSLSLSRRRNRDAPPRLSHTTTDSACSLRAETSGSLQVMSFRFAGVSRRH